MLPQLARSATRVSASTQVANFSKISYTLPNINDVAEQLIKSGSFNEMELEASVGKAKAVMAQNKVTKIADIIKLRESNEIFRTALQGIEKNKAAYLKSNLLLHYIHEQHTTEPVKVTVTGASGAIGYALLFRIASGEMLGKNQRVHLNLLELPGAMKALEGVVMELKDCAFPLLSGVTATSDPNVAFEDSSYALLVGAQPRSKGMERGDLLSANGKIFIGQGKAINDNARKEIKVLVVGNPANTNAFIAANSAPKIDPANFTAMTRLDHNRGLAQISEKTGKPVDAIKKFCIWGNHSSTQYPDVSNAQIDGKWAKDLLKQDWLEKTFIPTVQQRGAAIIAARGASSAASAAGSAIDHMRDWVLGTKGEWTSMAVLSDGSYGITKGLYSSFPVTCENGVYTIVQNVPIDTFSAARIEASHKELLEESNAVRGLLNKH